MKRLRKPIQASVSILLSLTLIFGLLTIIPVAAGAAVSVDYIDETGSPQTAAGVTELTTGSVSLSEGWYAVTENLTVSERITCEDDVRLILCDSCTLTAPKGITVGEDASLTIYAQGGGSGALVISQPERGDAGIGGSSATCGSILITGGVITAQGGEKAAGIGGGYIETDAEMPLEAGAVTVSGGRITATGGTDGAGIGAGYHEDPVWLGEEAEIKITGGTVTAFGSHNTELDPTVPVADTAAIGGYNSIISVTGGKVSAGPGGFSSDDEITLSWTNATDKIYGFDYVNNVRLLRRFRLDGTTTYLNAGVIDGQNIADIQRKTLIPPVLQTSVPYLDADGSQKTVQNPYALDGDVLTLEAGWYALQGNVTVNGRMVCTGDVRLILCDNCTLTLRKGITVNENSSLTVYAQSLGDARGSLIANPDLSADENDAAIGGSSDNNSGSVTINGGSIEAKAGNSGAGIGGGKSGAGNVTINGGNISASTNRNAAAIGGGRNGGATVVINGGTVTAEAAYYGAAIGGGWNGVAEVTVNGGDVTANATGYGPGIGSGQNASGGNVRLGWTNQTDRIFATSYRGNVTLLKCFLADGMTVFYEGVTGGVGGKHLAPYTPKEYTVTWKDIDGMTLRTDSVREDGNPSYGEEPSRPCLSFYGWTDGDTLYTQYYVLPSPTADVTYTAVYDVSYRSADGSPQTKRSTDFTVMTVSSTALSAGWYVLDTDVTIDRDTRINCTGDVYLILCDGCTLSVPQGIGVNENTATLTVYGQTDGDGTISIEKPAGNGAYAAIGGQQYVNSGLITINGGTFDVKGEYAGAAIGGGNHSDGTVVINGGVVTATGGFYSAAIGGGYNGRGNVTVNGGVVNVTGSIGDGDDANGSTISLSWTKATDSIKADSYLGGVTLVKDFTDGTTHHYAGAVDDNGTLAGKTLTPYTASNYTVTWKNDDGETLETATLREGLVPAYTGASPSHHPFTFYGWSDGSDTYVAGEQLPAVSGDVTYTAVYSLAYIGENGGVSYRLPGEYTVINSSMTSLSAGWYAVTENITIRERIACTGDVNLILCDGCTLQADAGITVNTDSSLTTFGQANGSGKLLVYDADNIQNIVAEGNAGIGGTDGQDSGAIIVNGGTLDAYAGKYAAAIGGGRSGAGSVTINRGSVETHGNYEGAGIGGGKSGVGNVTINGGTVTARGGTSAAAIGGGDGAACNITINGGSVKAYSDVFGVGIGGDSRTVRSVININGGSITVPEGASTVIGIGGTYNCGGFADVFLSWTDFDNDSIQAHNYYGDVTLRKDFTDGTHIFAAGLTEYNALKDTTLTPYRATSWAQLQAMINGVDGGATITLQQDYTALAEDAALTIPANKELILDLNGFTLDRDLDTPTENGCVILNNGSLTITDGSQAQNGAVTGGFNSGSGGGVTNNGVLTIDGGSFTANNANEGGAGIWTNNTLTLSGGTISGNTAGSGGNGGGIFFKAGTLSLSGSPVVTGNHDGQGGDNDLYISDAYALTIADTLTENAQIGIRRRTEDLTAVFTDGLSGNGSAANFISDHDGYSVALNAQGEAYLRMGYPHTVTVAQTVNGTVTASAASAFEGDTVTLTVTPDEGFAVTGVTVNGETLEPDDGVYSFDMPPTDVTVSAVFDYADGIGVRLAGHSLSLDGDIGVIFYMELSDAVIAHQNTAYMHFLIPSGERTVETEVLVKDARTEIIGNKTYYGFKCSVAAKEIDSLIQAQLIDGDRRSEVYTYAVRDYANTVLTDADYEAYYIARESAERLQSLRALVSALLVYGENAQYYFDKTETAPAQIDADIPLQYAEPTVDTPEGVTFTGATLSLRSKTSLSLYFVRDSAVEDVTLTMDGKTEGVDYELDQSGRDYVIRIRNIPSAELCDSFTVRVNGSGYVTYCPLTYCYKAVNGNAGDKLKNTVKALYLYWEQAYRYFKGNAGGENG